MAGSNKPQTWQLYNQPYNCYVLVFFITCKNSNLFPCPCSAVTVLNWAQVGRRFCLYFWILRYSLLWMKSSILHSRLYIMCLVVLTVFFCTFRGWRRPDIVLLTVPRPSNDWCDELCLRLWVNSYCVLMHLWNIFSTILTQCDNRNMQGLLAALHLVINNNITWHCALLKQGCKSIKSPSSEHSMNLSVRSFMHSCGSDPKMDQRAEEDTCPLTNVYL